MHIPLLYNYTQGLVVLFPLSYKLRRSRVLNNRKSFLNKKEIRYYTSKASSTANSYQSGLVNHAITEISTSFCEWFVGLADAESSFYFRIKPKAMEFEFKISLHLDDLPLLQTIQGKFGIGKIDIYGKMASYRVRRHDELLVLIDIFSKFPLNSVKYLNYLAFKQAFELYNSKSDWGPVVQKKIEVLKNSMNNQRTDFSMPDNHKIRVTPNWFGGFIEGEGSFSVQKKSFVLNFSLSQKNNTPLMKAIWEFLDNLRDVSNSISTINIKNRENFIGETSKGGNPRRSVVVSSFDNRIASRGEITNLGVSQEDYIANIFIPFLDSLSWYSKKVDDYNDWKCILELKKLGLHFTDEGIRVINLVLSQMNLNRLSTNPDKLSQSKTDNLTIDIAKLLSGQSNLEIKSDGRIFILSLNKYYNKGKKIPVSLFDMKGLFHSSFDSIKDCAKLLGISAERVSKRLGDNKPLLVGRKEFYVRYSESN